MGKRQHQKDKMYITYTEWTTLYGGKKPGHQSTAEEDNFKRLPFDHCCLSLQTFENPYCDLDGNIFDLEPLLPFAKKYKINPVTGKKLDMKELVKLRFYKDSSNGFQCPVLFKPFTKNSHIVTIAKTGNVYCNEAIEQLNIKNKNWKDLISDEPFERKDIITIQDPNNLGKFNISTFHHVKHNLRVETEEEIAARGDPEAKIKKMNVETRDTLTELSKEYKESDIKLNYTIHHEKPDKFNAAHYSTGTVAAGFTSTVMAPELVHQAAIIDENLVRYERVKKNGYVRLITNMGPLNLEIFCNDIPKTGENFIKHCQSGYYNGTKFFRSLRNFMIQGGDPNNTGRGGKSIWGKKFEDEFSQKYSHNGRGILAMANSGPNTNGSQFYITFRSCKQLDRKHTIFGKVVGGMETLSKMESIEVDNKDVPIEDILLVKAQVFGDPYEEADEMLAKERADELQKEIQEAEEKKRKLNAKRELKPFKEGVGKYINPKSTKTLKDDEKADEPSKINVKKKQTYDFNFSNW